MKKEIASEIKKKISKLKEIDIESLIEIPKNPKLGDYAIPTFSFAEKILGMNPAAASLAIVNELKTSDKFENVQSAGPYVNIFVKRKELAKKVIKKILKDKNSYGKEKEKKSVMIEFASPNTNKPLHLGHLRNICIGQSVSNILEFAGNKVTRVSINNDRGVHICKSMLAYEKWGKNKRLDKKGDHFVGDFYVLFAQKAKENPDLENEAQEMLKKWENGDKKVNELWEKMNAWAIEGFDETYNTLAVKFDKEYFESDIFKEGKKIVDEGLKKKIFYKKEDGAVAINLENEGLDEKVVLRADGTSVYITQDMYLAIKKNKDFKLDESVYVVANEQDYHFKTLFAILKKFNFEFANNLKHLSYGMVNLPDGKMKSREGTVVDADEIIEETRNLAEQELKERYKLTKKEFKERSLKIALAAIRYMLLKVDTQKNMLFNPKEAISFEGNTGPYILYTYARAKSIFDKAEKQKEIQEKEITDDEKEIISKLGNFPELVNKARKELSPSLICNYLYSLSQQFNEYYHKEKILGSENEAFRLNLVSSVMQVLKNGLSLLNIDILEKM